MASSSPASDFVQNPFFAPAESPFEAPAREPEGPATYAMIPSGPAVDASEVETDETATEIVVRWQDSILHIGHIGKGRSFVVGEATDADLSMSQDRLGTARLPVVASEGADAVAMIPAGASARIQLAGRTVDLAQAVAEQRAYASDGAHAVRLARGTRVGFDVGGLSFEIACVAAGRKVAGKTSSDRKPFALVALSAGVHAALLATMLHFMPPLSDTGEQTLTPDQAYMLQSVLKAQAEKELEETKEQTKADDAGPQGGGGDQAPGEPGKMGKASAPVRNATYAVQGDDNMRQLSRAEALQVAESFGMINVLADLKKDAPISPWSDVAMGMDPTNANGNLWGEQLADSFGDGGLYLSGIGEGAGGKGFGVGLGPGLGAGHGGLGSCLDASCQGFGRFGGSSGFLGRTRDAKVPTMRPTGETTVSGRIPPEVIQRVVRQNFGRFRGCYESALRNNPSLQGRVSVAFVIGRDGAVGSATSAGSDMPDSGVVSCVVRQFYGLSFPAPEGGVVKVTYPIMFTPG